MKFSTLFLALSIFSLNAFASLKDIGETKSPFKLADLPYKADSLEPFIDAETMSIHHDKHHQAYVTKLNENFKKKGASLISILQSVSKESEAVRNNAGGHWNHTFFWQIMSGDKAQTALPEELKKEIEAKFGSMDKFKAEFEKVGTGQFGSGWVWLIRNASGALEITSTPNQDNTLMDTAKTRGWPILGADIWEHAYYLKYKNERIKYLQNFWNVVNWKKVSELNEEAKSAKL